MDTDTETGSVIGSLILIVVLTMINAFFAAAEMAIVSLDKKKMEMDADNGDKKSRKILSLLKEQSRFLSTIQVGITFAGFFNSASAATGISNTLGATLENMGVPFAQKISFLSITLILAYLTLVFGELVPKRIALQNSKKFAKLSVGAISFVETALSPFVSLLSLSTNFVLRVLGISTKGVEEKVTVEEIKSIIQIGEQQGVINSIESDMITSVIKFDDIYAEEIMTARPDVFMIDADDKLDDYLEDMLKLKYSRIPVFENDVDNIIGILYLKDFLLEAYRVGFENVEIRKIIKPAYFAPKRKNIDELFNKLKSDNRHMALLIDEYGGFSGLVTMEDLIEEIVGDIDDEYDHDEPDIEAIDRYNYIANGAVSIKELNSRLNTEIDENSDEYDTLGGLIIFLLGYIPKAHERPALNYLNMEMEVTKAKNNRIQTVRIKLVDEINTAKVSQEELLDNRE